MDERKLIVLSGPSGCGKDTILRRIRELDPSVAANISYTTRTPRPGETDGINYHFVSREEFRKNIDSGMMLEYNEYAGNYYGTSKKTINGFLEKGTTVVLTIDVNGGRNVKSVYPGAMLLFLMPPSIRDLRERINNRGKMDEEELKARLRIAEEEILYARQYDKVIVNRDIEECAQECLAAIRAWGKAGPESSSNTTDKLEDT
ncbi:MAG: guanylate kinase [Oscillospiraceae bacterium]|nr:guanylate kinase [Oscillospiraceae bacterium]